MSTILPTLPPLWLAMSKKFKAQASSARATSGFGAFGAFQTATSPLSYIAEQPDLSNISNPNVVVALKNIGKRDSTTKAKALDELLEYLKDTADLAIITAWSDVYPRTSIDNSQIVRRNAHVLQGILTENAGKKIVPLLPKIIPSWLAGTYDNDKSVAKAAVDALNKTFATAEKKTALWTIYKDAIYERVQDSLLTQTALTLSDERTTSADEAEAKYVRVTGTGIRLLNRLLLDRFDGQAILGEKKLWEFVYHEDSYLRNAISALLLTVLSKDTEILDWTVLSHAFIHKGMNVSQVGSAKAFTEALSRLTRFHPSVWTSDYNGKTTASKRLLQYLRRGSQYGPQDTWSLFYSLVTNIPVNAWKKGSDDSSTLAEAYRTGVMIEKIHVDAAWSSYIRLCSWLCEDLQDADVRDSFVDQNIGPLVISYVNKSMDEKWRIGGRPDHTAEIALQAIGESSNFALQKTWTALVDSTIEKMRLSLPESSKDFRASQDAVTSQGKRLLALHTKASGSGMSKSLRMSVINAAIELLRSRNGKPYGAASIIAEFSRTTESLDEPLRHFLETDLDAMLDSPSVEQIVSLATRTGIEVGFKLLRSPSKSVNIKRGTEYFLRHGSQEQLEQEGFTTLLLEKIGDFETETSCAYAVSLLANPQLPKDGVKAEILLNVVSDLNKVEKQENAISMLEALILHPALTQDLAQAGFGMQLASKLLLLADSSNTSLSDRASALMAAFSTAEDPASSSVPIIRQQLRGEGDCLSILTLTDLGLKSLKSVQIQDLLPDPEDWHSAIASLCTTPIISSLSITSPLQGAVWLVEINDKKNEAVIRDSEDFSLLFRITFFVTKILAGSSLLVNQSGPRSDALYRWYPVALEVINEKLTLDEANSIWLGSTPEVLYAASDVLSEGNQMLNLWLEKDDFVQDWLLRGSELEGLGRESYLVAVAFHRFVSELFNVRPQEILQTYADSLATLHKSEDVLESSALLAALNAHLTRTSNGLKMVNELLSHVTQTPTDFRQMMLLNILLSGDPVILEKIPQQRLVFLFKRLVGHLREVQDGKSISESFRLVAFVIPYVLEIYSDLWENLIQSLSLAWITTEISIIHSMLLVYAQFTRASKKDEVNDDLRSALRSYNLELDNGLLMCLQSLNSSSTEVDQPRAITASFLGRQLTNVKVPDTVDLFSLLSSGQAAVRQAAYDLLHRTVPAKQEQLSIDLALDQKIAELPEELVSLISDSSDISRYLLSWKIVFDHFPTASFRLREMYTANIKADKSIDMLLDLLCEKLRILSGRALDASKFEVTEYSADLADTGDQNLQWLSIHLYYLALLFTPSLVKDWFLQQKNRIKQPLEAWTQKYMSPLIVASSVTTVTKWSQDQDQDDRPIEIKASPRGSEIVASIAVDPESPPISLCVSLPSAYPLESPTVSSRTRVGVSEKNWNSWLRTFQIIIFSSGSIIEGLVAFRRNVQGALKGQTECAICYSIIGTDRQTPNKKCGTCKNMFHGACLFKWFKSSNSSSCPLCRNNFNYA